MRLLRTLLGALAGLLAGTVIAFTVAVGVVLVIDPAEHDPSGLRGLTTAILWTPLGSVIGLFGGAILGSGIRR